MIDQNYLRFNYLYSELEKIFPDKKPYSAEPPELRLIEDIKNELDKYKTALKSISRLNPTEDTEDGVWDEWGEAECFNMAQRIAREAIDGR